GKTRDGKTLPCGGGPNLRRFRTRRGWWRRTHVARAYVVIRIHAERRGLDEPQPRRLPRFRRPNQTERRLGERDPHGHGESGPDVRPAIVQGFPVDPVLECGD